MVRNVVPHQPQPEGPVARPQASAPDSNYMQTIINSVRSDVRDIEAFYSCNISRTRTARLTAHFHETLRKLDQLPFEQLDRESQADYILLSKYIARQLQGLQSMEAQREEWDPWIQPFADQLIVLLERRQKVTPTSGKDAADTLDAAAKGFRSKASSIAHADAAVGQHRLAAYRAANELSAMISLLEEWHEFYSGYDPSFTWWVKAPYEDLLQSLRRYCILLREKVVGIGPNNEDAIVGQPAGRESILASLDAQFIAYTPEELISVGEKEYEWCLAEITKASKSLGYGEDWRAALEHVKNEYVPPGQQTYMVHELFEEAVAYVKERDMVTVPPIAEECWRTLMTSPARQKANPFFLGGQELIVSYPTDTMSHQDKLMSMRGNSRPFSRSTVFHELIPGHHLQFYMIERYRNYRCLFDTPFWMEGWAFYWEMILWDRGFAATPDEKIGMLFWRMHRCIRIIFSLKFHLGELTPQECIDMLVDRVGHERATAEGEVRRSFNGDYSPLYQAGYMIGALQFYAMRKEMVEDGGMAEKDFHDRILREGEMPIDILRALLQDKTLKSDHKAEWRFYKL